MRITKLEVMWLKVGYRKIFRGGGGIPEYSYPVFVRVFTDEGIDGVGEARIANPYQGETVWSAMAAIKNYYAPAIMGENPFAIEKLWAKMDYVLPGNTHARACIDLALHDIMGKALGIPIYDLLGGLCHEKIPLKFSIGLAETREMVEESSKLVNQYGVKCLKVKIGPFGALDRDIGNVEAIRKAVGDDIALVVDGNCSYNTPYEAIKVIREIEPYNIILVEQPLPGWDLEGMAEVARVVETPILADESVFTLQDAYNVISLKAADVLCVKLPKAGGLHSAKKIAGLAESAGFPVFAGTDGATGVGSMAVAHYYASTRNMWPFTSFMWGPYMCVHHLLSEDPLLEVRDGYFEPPKKPGLGVEIDEEALRKYAKDRYIVKE